MGEERREMSRDGDRYWNWSWGRFSFGMCYSEENVGMHLWPERIEGRRVVAYRVALGRISVAVTRG